MEIEDKKSEREVNASIVSASVIRTDLREYARKRWPVANDKYRKDRLRTLLDLTERRIKSFWQGEETAVPRTAETNRIERLIGKKLGTAADVEEAVRNDFLALAERMARLEARLAQVDAEFHQPQMAGLGQELNGRRGNYGSDAAASMADEEDRWTSISD